VLYETQHSWAKKVLNDGKIRPILQVNGYIILFWIGFEKCWRSIFFNMQPQVNSVHLASKFGVDTFYFELNTSIKIRLFSEFSNRNHYTSNKVTLVWRMYEDFCVNIASALTCTSINVIFKHLWIHFLNIYFCCREKRRHNQHEDGG